MKCLKNLILVVIKVFSRISNFNLLLFQNLSACDCELVLILKYFAMWIVKMFCHYPTVIDVWINIPLLSKHKPFFCWAGSGYAELVVRVVVVVVAVEHWEQS